MRNKTIDAWHEFGTMLTAVREHHGLARMPCYIGDETNHKMK